jgi:RNA polymerase sigma factor (sigma-70 family)
LTQKRSVVNEMLIQYMIDNATALKGLIRRIVKLECLVEEAYQEAAIRVMMAKYYSSDYSSPKNWIHTVVSNAAKNYVRNERAHGANREGFIDNIGTTETPDIPLQRREAVKALREVVAGMSTNRRAVINLKMEDEDKTFPQIAKELNSHPETVKARCREARGVIYRKLGPEVLVELGYQFTYLTKESSYE